MFVAVAACRAAAHRHRADTSVRDRQVPQPEQARHTRQPDQLAVARLARASAVVVVVECECECEWRWRACASGHARQHGRVRAADEEPRADHQHVQRGPRRPLALLHGQLHHQVGARLAARARPALHERRHGNNNNNNNNNSSG